MKIFKRCYFLKHYFKPLTQSGSIETLVTDVYHLVGIYTVYIPVHTPLTLYLYTNNSSKFYPLKYLLIVYFSRFRIFFSLININPSSFIFIFGTTLLVVALIILTHIIQHHLKLNIYLCLLNIIYTMRLYFYISKGETIFFHLYLT